MAEHLITRDHAQAGYSAEHEPVLTVTPGAGDRIVFETDDAAYAQMEEHRDLAKITATLNPVTGPVHIEGPSPATPSRSPSMTSRWPSTAGRSTSPARGR